jgi:hypothetical protein
VEDDFFCGNTWEWYVESQGVDLYTCDDKYLVIVGVVVWAAVGWLCPQERLWWCNTGFITEDVDSVCHGIER